MLRFSPLGGNRLKSLCQQNLRYYGTTLASRQVCNAPVELTRQQTRDYGKTQKTRRWPSSPSVRFSSSQSTNEADDSEATNKSSTLNRWRVLLPAVVVELTMGSIYCASMWTMPLTQLAGVVAPAPGDFSVSEVVPILSLAAVGLGCSSATLGSWMEKAGPQKACSVGASCWFTGLMTCAAAAKFQSLPLLYLGYGVFGGMAWSMLYLSPVSTTMKWFPDRRGLATGITLSSFGAGMAVAPPLIDFFTGMFFVAPEFLGTATEVALMTLADGSQVLASDGTTQVVVATANDAAKVNLSEGVYTVGTGDSGASGAFASLACLYGAVAMAASQFMKAPPEGWLPEGFVVDQSSTAGTAIGITDSVAVRQPQFPLLWFTTFGNAVGGMALISASKLVMTDVWSAALPTVVTASFATAYVTSIGMANSFGRFSWAVLSDKIGRKTTYTIFGLGMPVLAGTPYLISYAMENPSTLPLAVFVGGSFFAICNYGGIFSVLPAYIADLFGQKHSTSIHGKALTAWSASAVAGPLGLTWLRSRAEHHAIDDLITKVDPAAFESTFGAALAQKDLLIQSKTVTISRLMEIVPSDVPDPTPHLYDTTFFAAAGLIGLAAVCNRLLKPPNVQKLLKNL